ncbi:hypothetical protein [Burkholderia pseudomallei]|uniref:hypothetical protein n=1 Tax=Burkholderia pseudomallei TaxID=28450 RepID=UPI001178A8AA|nr:hypothetical protein [Burkholderia pseudomallei]
MAHGYIARPNPYVHYASDIEAAATRMRHAIRKEQAVDCLRSIRHFLEIAEKEIEEYAALEKRNETR